MAETDPFVHLHVHNEYSMLDGAAQIAPMMKHVAEELHQPAIATTNHGFMYDSYEFTNAAEKAGIKPIIGVEAYIAPESRTIREERPFKGVAGTEDRYSHMTILAENNDGLHNLFRLSSLASLEGFYYKPRMDRELLSQHASGLIATTGCLGGEVNQLLLRGEKQKALEAASEFRDIFGQDNFFYEIMDHDIPEERAIFNDQLDIAKKLGLQLVATNDCHYLHHDQKDAHQALLCVQTGSTLDNPSMTFNDGFHVKSSQEMRTLWRDYQNACDNTLLIAERCNTTMEPRNDLYPEYPVPAGHTFASYLREVTWAGIAERYGHITQKIKDRVEYELGIVEAKNYPGYFLVVSDFVKWGKLQGIMFGPARGSGGGSIIAYALHITDIDPIQHGLLFERFLNPERPSAPDFDIDIQDDRRGEVIDYVSHKYGEEYVAQIVTYGNIKGKSAIKDATRVLGQPPAKSDMLTKLYPKDVMGKGASLKEVFDEGVNSDRYREGERLRSAVNTDADSKRIIEVARGLEGMKRQVGVHAAAIVVSSHKLIDLIPIWKRPADGAIVTQFDYPTCESLGLLKMDFLGLTNLSTLSKARDHVKKRTGEDIVYTDLPLNDQKTFEMLARGETMGVFQLDSDDMRKLMRKMRPTEFEDISAVGALYRPGPMGVNSHNKYADRKNGREAVDYIHPELTEILKPILGPTYGLCVPVGTPIYDSAKGQWTPIENLEAGISHTPSLNETTGQVELKQVNHVVHTGTKPIVKITLNGGRSLRLSTTHPVLTDNGYVEAGKLAPSTRVRMASTAFHEEGTGNSNFTGDTAYLLGALLGDGTITSTNQHFFTNSDEELLAEVAQIAEANFQDTFTTVAPRIRAGKHYTNVLTLHSGTRGETRRGRKAPSSAITKWLKSVGYSEEMDSQAKYISDELFKCDNEVLSHAVAGLWDTDGTTETGLHFTTISKKMWEGMQYALTRLGVDFGVSATPYSNPKRPDQVAYRVFPVYSDFAQKVLPYLRSTRKRENAKTFEGVSRNGAERYLSVAEELFTEWVTSNGDPQFFTTRLSNTIGDHRKVGWKSATSYIERAFGVRYASKREFVRGLATLGIGDAEYSAKVEARYRVVTAVEDDGFDDCYDIEVADNHNFLVNGAVVHNCVYQEQVMEMGQVLADYTLGEADNLRRIMGKKKKEEVDAAKPHFENKMREKGFSREAFEAVWAVIVPFSDYAFNKSHAAAYGLVSYWTAYMKAHYPVEYMAALLTDSMDDPKAMAVYLGECRRMGIKILPPDVNISSASYTPFEDDSIVFGLSGIKGVSDASSVHIIDGRPESGYVDLTDFFFTTGSNVAVGKALAVAGAFDAFGYSRAGILDVLQDVTSLASARRKSVAAGEWDLLSTIDITEDGQARTKLDPPVPEFEWDKDERLEREYNATHIYLSGHPLEGRTRALEIESTCSWNDALTLQDGETVIIGGLLTDVSHRVSKRGNPWAEMNLRGVDAVVALRCFDKKLLASKQEAFQSGKVVMVKATVIAEDESYFFKVDNIKVVNTLDEEVVEPEPVEILVKPEHLTKDLANKMERLARNSRGTVPLTLVIAGTGKRMRLPYRVKPDERLKRALIENFGPACLVSGF